MQLEIKIVIDFGDGGMQPIPDQVEYQVLRTIERELAPKMVFQSFTVSMGWTSSGDDE